MAENAGSQPSQAAQPELTYLDLFCGCGGFSLGMARAGFRCLAAIDSDPHAVSAYRTNLPEVAHVLEKDLTRFHPQDLEALLGAQRVDVIVGGPPCQGFSKVRQRDGSNSGPRMVHDHRRHLYRELLRYVEHFQPKVFVMENVLGIRVAAGGEYLTRVQKEARALGYRVHGQVENAYELGVPQKRQRQLFIGTRLDIPHYFPGELKPAPRARCETGRQPASDPGLHARRAVSGGWTPSSLAGQDAQPTLWEAIGDLPPLETGQGENECEYDLERRQAHIQTFGRRFLFDVLEIERAVKLTAHCARPHSDRDLRDFALLREGESSAVAMRRGVVFEFPYDKENFKDRYTRQSRYGPCSTIVAHLSKDGLMFIHPTQNRSLTPREAARVQTFPDWFRFPELRTRAYRLIGNAVPPLVAEAVGLAVKEFLTNTCRSRREEAQTEMRNAECGMRNENQSLLTSAPTSRHTAARELERLARLDRRALRALPREEFLQGWHALLFLFPGLHPDNALDHGDDIEEIPTEQLGLPGFERQLDRRHTRSGWPVALELIGREAWRRYERGELPDDEFYCVAAQRAGLEPPTTREEAGRKPIKEQPA
ncbi:MAG: DNA cytosine methyltransferase [Verrucomicrobiota bacterium]